MKGFIIKNSYFDIADISYQCKRLKDEFLLLGVEIDILNSIDVLTSIYQNELKNTLIDYKFGIFLDKDKYMMASLTALGIPLFNSYPAITVCDDKMLTLIALSKHGIRIPNTIGGVLCYDQSATLSPLLVSKLEQTLGYPMIVKESFGSMGKGVYLADSRPQLLTLMDKVKCRLHHFQQFISSSFGRDIRVIVIGNKVIGAMMRESSCDFRSNVALGGHGTPYTLTPELTALALRIAAILGLDYCGIDLLISDDDGYLVCEVNSNAFFSEFERVTLSNVAHEYAQHIITKIADNKR